MDLHEYQGKELFQRVGLRVPGGRIAHTPEDAERAAAELGGGRVVVKAQVLTGGRGKAGGVKVADGPQAARQEAAAILGMDIRGYMVHQVLVEEATPIARELYAAVVLDRGGKQTLAMLSAMGGMEVEKIALMDPRAMACVGVDPLFGWSDFHARRLAFDAGLGELAQPLGDVFARLYRIFTESEATLCEVNPLVVAEDGGLLVLDAKVSVDNNSLFRHPDIAAMRDVHSADPHEQMAFDRSLTYVKLDGEVGVLGNGAGLVMSTLDVVANAGGRPANFLDVGGGAKAEEIVAALEVITADPKVRSILFNIFGGITRCDEVARGVLAAVGQMGIALPIVVRLDGTNEHEGRAMLAAAGVPNIYVATTMPEAAHRAVDLAAATGA